MKGYVRWRGQLDAMMEHSAIDCIETQVRMEFEQELSSGNKIPDDVLQDMRRVTARLLADAKDGSGVQAWRQLGWWRDPADPTRAIMYT